MSYYGTTINDSAVIVVKAGEEIPAPAFLAVGADGKVATAGKNAIGIVMPGCDDKVTVGDPAIVTQQVLAQLLGFEQVKVLESTYNGAKPGEEADMQFICDSNAALMCYATNTPQIDEPSAGYIFTWDMLGNGSYTAMDQYEGENGTHSEFIEGLMSTDMRKTADDLATYFTDCV